jgi:hypothetical protein
MNEGFKQELERAIIAKTQCEEYSTITINSDWGIDVYVSPSEEKVHHAVSCFTGLVGKLEKKQALYGTSFEFVGHNAFLSVRITTPEQCKIVGYKIERKPKKVVVESAEMEEVKTPVTDCDFRAGRVKAGEFEPIKETVNV